AYHHVKRGRLARAVGPEQPHDLPLLDAEANPADHLAAAVGLLEPFAPEHGLVHGFCSASCTRCGENTPRAFSTSTRSSSRKTTICSPRSSSLPCHRCGSPIRVILRLKFSKTACL